MDKKKRKKETILKQKNSQGDIETLASFRVFKLEFNRLHKLYDNSIRAYQIAREFTYDQIKSGKLSPNDSIDFESFEKNKFRIGMAQNAAHNLRVQFPRNLRELVFIRLISALEIFLIDAIKEAFLVNKALLKPSREDFLRISENEFLAYPTIEEALSTYIERKCRNLHSQGYEEVKKFYFKNVGVDFAKAEIKVFDISHYHDQRHLLVHTLGKTDAQYRHKYSSVDKRISIDENYLLQASKDINILALYINESLIRLVRN